MNCDERRKHSDDGGRMKLSLPRQRILGNPVSRCHQLVSRLLGAGLALTASALTCVGPAQSAELRQMVERYRVTHEGQILAQLDGLVRIRSVAADPVGLHAAARMLVDALRRRGFEAQALTEGGAPPLVTGQWRAAGAVRTVVFYAHYDGQPVNPSQWRSDPFTPVLRSGPSANARLIDWRTAAPPFDPEGRLFGRAAADDKASIIAFLAAFDALRAAHVPPAINIKVVWEGEEEEGSPHLEQELRQHAALLSADLWLIGDGPIHQSGAPMLYFGARGVIGLDLTVYGANRALHDGHYGNWAPNPAALAATLIASMRAPDGRILIPGFDAGVQPLTAAEQQAIRALPSVDRALQQTFGIGQPESEQGLALSLMRPALNVRGLRAGEVGPAAANAIPTEAHISLDFRLVPDQTIAGTGAAVERFLQAQGWTVVREPPDAATRIAYPRLIRVQWGAGYPALRTDLTSPAAQAVVRAARAAASRPVALMPMMGASVPIYLIDEILHARVVGLPIVNYDDNQHAANENLRLQNLWDGIELYAQMMATLHW